MGFIDDVLNIYDDITKEKTENLEKIQLIELFKCKYGVEGRIGEFYLKSCANGNKEKGRVYTPPHIASYMVKKYVNNLT